MEFDRQLLVSLVAECELVRAGVTTMLAGHADRVCVQPRGSATSDVALLDPFTRHAGGEPAVRAATAGAARVAVYTWETRRGFVDRAMAQGVDGYLSKALPATELIAALLKINAGERFIALDDTTYGIGSRRPLQVPLTPREAEVVSMIAAGASNVEIARRLELSMNTVKSHIRTAYRTMGVTSRTQAVLWAVEHGLTASRVPLHAVRRAATA